ncbi:hypothetical protein [Shewanella sp. Isolate8]|uniref:hypothetical protein n=1 Tax=Shewanella sp. Isolate8 TaxID=2908529 RepID=UPI001EFCBE2F|nr:hypothetical protein [Shewanella sp. Isolate8]MCG9748134.1 hypothetical protein [Shewanella sp. Isolate8]
MDEEKYVECGTHGKQQATFVCQHIIQTLHDGKARGFWWANDPENPRPDAWCSECEVKVQETNGEWNDESEAFAGVKLLCGACYDRVKEINLGPNKQWWQFWK